MKSTVLQKSLDLQKGLFLIRYESAEDASQPPKVSLSAGSVNTGAIEFLLPPGEDEPVMWSPGANLVVRLSAPARLQIEVSARSPGGSVGARLQSAELSTDPLGLAALDEAPIDFSSARLLGHLSGRGDVLVAPGEWLGGPMAPTRIEGVGIEWADRPHNFGLRHSVRIGSPRETKTTDLIDAGGYSGTRGRAMPIVGATFEIFGPATQHYEIVAEGIFLGSPQMKVSGQRVVLSGPSGREPLVGLRLQIVSTRPMSAPAPVAAPRFEPSPPPSLTRAPEPAPAAPLRAASGRVRVFRSRATAGKT